MREKVVAALLIFGWVLLSGLDLIEDFGEVSASGVLSNSASPDSSKLKRHGWGALANNIVESAARLPQTPFDPASPVILRADGAADFDFRRCFRLHKLYRVFLI